MNNKAAVNWLINLTSDIGKAEHRDLWHYEQALIEIKEMLEKQIPKKAELCYEDLICPVCGSDVEWKRYCEYCGQKIDWGES